MRIATVVGIRGAGKTTIVEALIREMKARGYTVGTIKTVFCPTFHMDKPGSNTDRHVRAGSGLVTARGERETALIYPRRLKPSELLAPYAGFDWVLCEGDYELPVPRIVAAHGAEDALERVNGQTVAVSGLIANEQEALAELPVLHPERDIQRLADLLERQVPETTDLRTLDETLHGPDLPLSRGFCVRSCRGHHQKPSGVRVTVDGTELCLTPQQEQEIRRWGERKTL